MKKHGSRSLLVLLSLGSSLLAQTVKTDPAAAIDIQFVGKPGPVATTAVEAFRRHLRTRCGTAFAMAGSGPLKLRLQVDTTLPPQAFEILDQGPQVVRIAGGDEQGVLYGVGRFLHTSVLQPGRFTPSTWRGKSVPDKPVRCSYYATHFNNWYHVAPLDEIRDYTQDLALWGNNGLAVWLDMNKYRSIADPECIKMIARLKAMMAFGKQAGMSISLVSISNEGYSSTPEALKADWRPHPEAGIIAELGAHYHVEICPSKPGGTELILKQFREKIAAFRDVGIDEICFAAYDPGGCTCPDCRPWGYNGCLKICEKQARIFRGLYPHGKVCLSVWYFDSFAVGEWEGLTRAFARRPDWLDYLVIDDNTHEWPKYPREHGVPGGLPAIGFPEISMFSLVPAESPWGGFGANPFPNRLERYWAGCSKHIMGGAPYSEGIFEDMNKVILAQLYWQSDRKIDDIVAEYAGFEYGPQVVSEVVRAARLLDKTILRTILRTKEEVGWQIIDSADVPRAAGLLEEANAKLPPKVQASWRWRILYLRSQLDLELASHGGFCTPRCESMFQELTKIYHAETADTIVAPPTAERRRANRGR